MIGIPKWLTRAEEDYEFPPMPIPTAVIEKGNQMTETNGSVSVDLTTVPPRDILQQAAVLATQYETDKAHWSKVIEEATSRIKDLAREIEFLRLELSQKTNDLQTTQATIEELRQDNSELRALHGALHAQAKHLVVQYENFHIPLPARKRAKKTTEIDDEFKYCTPECNPQRGHIRACSKYKKENGTAAK